MDLTSLAAGNSRPYRLVKPSAPPKEYDYDPDIHHELLFGGRSEAFPNEGERAKTTQVVGDILNPEESYDTSTQLMRDSAALSNRNVENLNSQEMEPGFPEVFLRARREDKARKPDYGAAAESSGSDDEEIEPGSPEPFLRERREDKAKKRDCGAAAERSSGSDGEDGEVQLQIGDLTIVSSERNWLAGEREAEQSVRLQPVLAYPVTSSMEDSEVPSVIAVAIPSTDVSQERTHVEVDASTLPLTFQELCTLFGIEGIELLSTASRSKYDPWGETYLTESEEHSAEMRRNQTIAKQVLMDPRLSGELSKARDRFKKIMGFNYGQQCKNYCLDYSLSQSERKKRKDEIEAAKENSGLSSVMDLVETLRGLVPEKSEESSNLPRGIKYGDSRSAAEETRSIRLDRLTDQDVRLARYQVRVRQLGSFRTVASYKDWVMAQANSQLESQGWSTLNHKKQLKNELEVMSVDGMVKVSLSEASRFGLEKQTIKDAKMAFQGQADYEAIWSSIRTSEVLKKKVGYSRTSALNFLEEARERLKDGFYKNRERLKDGSYRTVNNPWKINKEAQDWMASKMYSRSTDVVVAWQNAYTGLILDHISEEMDKGIANVSFNSRLQKDLAVEAWRVGMGALIGELEKVWSGCHVLEVLGWKEVTLPKLVFYVLPTDVAPFHKELGQIALRRRSLKISETKDTTFVVDSITESLSRVGEVLSSPETDQSIYAAIPIEKDRTRVGTFGEKAYCSKSNLKAAFKEMATEQPDVLVKPPIIGQMHFTDLVARMVATKDITVVTLYNKLLAEPKEEVTEADMIVLVSAFLTGKDTEESLKSMVKAVSGSRKNKVFLRGLEEELEAQFAQSFIRFADYAVRNPKELARTALTESGKMNTLFILYIRQNYQDFNGNPIVLSERDLTEDSSCYRRVCEMVKMKKHLTKTPIKVMVRGNELSYRDVKDSVKSKFQHEDKEDQLEIFVEKMMGIQDPNSTVTLASSEEALVEFLGPEAGTFKAIVRREMLVGNKKSTELLWKSELERVLARRINEQYISHRGGAEAISFEDFIVVMQGTEKGRQARLNHLSDQKDIIQKSMEEMTQALREQRSNLYQALAEKRDLPKGATLLEKERVTLNVYIIRDKIIEVERELSGLQREFEFLDKAYTKARSLSGNPVRDTLFKFTKAAFDAQWLEVHPEDPLKGCTLQGDMKVLEQPPKSTEDQSALMSVFEDWISDPSACDRLVKGINAHRGLGLARLQANGAGVYSLRELTELVGIDESLTPHEIKDKDSAQKFLRLFSGVGKKQIEMTRVEGSAPSFKVKVKEALRVLSADGCLDLDGIEFSNGPSKEALIEFIRDGFLRDSSCNPTHPCKINFGKNIDALKTVLKKGREADLKAKDQSYLESISDFGSVKFTVDEEISLMDYISEALIVNFVRCVNFESFSINGISITAAERMVEVVNSKVSFSRKRAHRLGLGIRCSRGRDEALRTDSFIKNISLSVISYASLNERTPVKTYSPYFTGSVGTVSSDSWRYTLMQSEIKFPDPAGETHLGIRLARQLIGNSELLLACQSILDCDEDIAEICSIYPELQTIFTQLMEDKGQMLQLIFDLINKDGVFQVSSVDEKVVIMDPSGKDYYEQVLLDSLVHAGYEIIRDEGKGCVYCLPTAKPKYPKLLGRYSRIYVDYLNGGALISPKEMKQMAFIAMRAGDPKGYQQTGKQYAAIPKSSDIRNRRLGLSRTAHLSGADGSGGGGGGFLKATDSLERYPILSLVDTLKVSARI